MQLYLNNYLVVSFEDGTAEMIKLKVSKSQMQILKFSFEPKNEQKYFCIFALASKIRKDKGTLYH